MREFWEEFKPRKRDWFYVMLGVLFIASADFIAEVCTTFILGF